MGMRFWSSRRKVTILVLLLLIVFSLLFFYTSQILTLNELSLNSRLKNIWGIRNTFTLDNGGRCNLPNLPVNSSIMMKFVKEVPPIKCIKGGVDWAICKKHECKVKNEIIEKFSSIKCHYSDVVWVNDNENKLGRTTTIEGSDSYFLEASDFVDVFCEGEKKDDAKADKYAIHDLCLYFFNCKTYHRWSGTLIGIRNSFEIKKKLSWEKPNGQAIRYNVIMLGFDSLSRNTFIRKLPKSYKVLTEELNCHVLEGYNIVGDGTPQALIPILTGFTELELPDTRKRMGSKAYFVNEYPLIWNDFTENGYVTAFQEDTPNVGIFTYRLKGFSNQPTDHYMRQYYVHTEPRQKKWTRFCYGDTPKHKIMLNYCKQFIDAYAEYPKFLFAFHGELSHDDYNLIQAADDDLVDWMRDLKKSKVLDNSIFILMSDHGHRFANIRDTLQGKQEERLPWFSFVFPPDFKFTRPGALDNFKENTKRLTTPFDIHATFLDILGLNPNDNYDIHSKFPPRSLSLFGPISPNRTCGQAGIEAHWCACLNWNTLSVNEPIAQRLADHLVGTINEFLQPFLDRCALLSIDKIEWVMSLGATEDLLSFKKTMDKDGFLPDLSATTSYVTTMFQIKVRLMPGASLFEATLSYNVDEDFLTMKLSDVSRINKYGSQARCILNDQPQLRKYCYCTKD